MNIVVGFLGCGNIGSGVYRLLREEAQAIAHREGLSIEVRRVLVRDISKARKHDIPAGILTTDPAMLYSDPDISIVIECMGGAHPAREYLLAALDAGKTVVTANKEVIALHWHELQEAAQRSGAGLYYEASAAGGIPIVRALNDSLQANHIDRLYGIINGTTNHILCEMARGQTYGDALGNAQALGLAEPDPTYDVGGMDAAFKLSILSTIAFHSRIPVDSVHVEGIQSLDPEDLRAADEMGYAVKLLGIAKRYGQQVEARVHPTMIPKAHPLASVSGSFNAIYLRGSAVGEMMLYGRGAGEQPTASAIVSDLLIAAGARTHRYPTFQNRPNLPDDLDVLDDWSSRYYLRVTATDRPGVLARLAGVLGAQGISIASLVQREGAQGRASIRLMTHDARERAMQSACDALRELPDVAAVDCLLRVESLADEGLAG